MRAGNDGVRPDALLDNLSITRTAGAYLSSPNCGWRTDCHPCGSQGTKAALSPWQESPIQENVTTERDEIDPLRVQPIKLAFGIRHGLTQHPKASNGSVSHLASSISKRASVARRSLVKPNVAMMRGDRSLSDAIQGVEQDRVSLFLRLSS